MRARLRDDSARASLGTCRTVVDGDSVPVRLDGDCSVAAVVQTGPRVWVKDRRDDGMDENDNPRWSWVLLVDGVPSIMWEQREARDERAGVTLVRGRVRIPYRNDATQIRETASVRTEDGHVWYVTALTRGPRDLLIEMERVEDGV